MMRTFTFRLLPNFGQRAKLVAILEECCELYNAALQERREAWARHRKSITYRMQQDELTDLRRDARFTKTACAIQRDPLRRLDRAFQAFFRRVKTGQEPGFPRFRSRRRYDSFSFPLDGVGEKLLIPKLGEIRMRGGRSVQGKPKLCTVQRIGTRWNARVVADVGEAPSKLPVSNAVGIDLGVSCLVALSDGERIENPRWVRQHEARIAAANQCLARKQRGSRGRSRARERLGRVHRRAADARNNFLHHVSKWLVATYGLIAYEDLNIRGMVQSRLAKGIMDAAWGVLIRQLAYKAENAGRYLVAVDPRGTSQRCSRCGACVPKTLSERQHVCACGADLDRDHNAALNVLRLGMSRVGPAPPECVST
jgi:putative transposase